uniref:Putative rRNA methyltransferase n=1 Tax=Rhizophora mucronata TaxID=61149 RepID=A0A2P2J8P1_RHIMU
MTPLSPIIFLTLALHSGLVISCSIETAPRMGAILTKSMPRTRLPTGARWTATCIQPPGAAQRSRTAREEWRNLNLLSSWTSFQEARER